MTKAATTSPSYTFVEIIKSVLVFALIMFGIWYVARPVAGWVVDPDWNSLESFLMKGVFSVVFFVVGLIVLFVILKIYDSINRDVALSDSFPSELRILTELATLKCNRVVTYDNDFDLTDEKFRLELVWELSQPTGEEPHAGTFVVETANGDRYLLMYSVSMSILRESYLEAAKSYCKNWRSLRNWQYSDNKLTTKLRELYASKGEDTVPQMYFIISRYVKLDNQGDYHYVTPEIVLAGTYQNDILEA